MQTRAQCQDADRVDPLAALRQAFVLPGGVIYLDGNSLGPMPRTAPARAARILEREWGEGLVRSWNTAGWFELPARLGGKLAALVGAGADEVVVTDSISLNVFKALAAALRLQREEAPGRRVILSERGTFPTDLYMVEGMIDFLGQYELRLADGDLPLERALDGDVAVALLSHVDYRTGAMHDLADLTARAHRVGARVIWDLAHSAGAVPIDLRAAGADFAVGCTYKYLNGGPGSTAFIWVAKALQDRCRQPLSGWWGHRSPFAMAPGYEPAAGIRHFQCGTQPVLSMALVECGLDLALRADMREVRAKSLALGDLFIELARARCPGHPLALVTPSEHARRGSHVSFRHPHGHAVIQAMIDRGVIGDYREPELMRFGLAPLYLRYVDVWDAVEVLREVLDGALWDRPEFARRGVVT